MRGSEAVHGRRLPTAVQGSVQRSTMPPQEKEESFSLLEQNRKTIFIDYVKETGRFPTCDECHQEMKRKSLMLSVYKGERERNDNGVGFQCFEKHCRNCVTDMRASSRRYEFSLRRSDMSVCNVSVFE